MNIAVLVSGNGSNLQALLEAERSDRLSGGRIVLVISDNPGAFALERARDRGVETFVLEPGSFSSRVDYDRKISERLKIAGVEIVLLAGFMRLLSDEFVDEYEGRIMNVHPALLPAFKGKHGIGDAFDYGVKVTGVTVHFVDKGLDSGPIILQEEVIVEENDTVDSLENKIHRVEHKLYPEAVRLFVSGRLSIKGRKVFIAGKG